MYLFTRFDPIGKPARTNKPAPKKAVYFLMPVINIKRFNIRTIK